MDTSEDELLGASSTSTLSSAPTPTSVLLIPPPLAPPPKQPEVHTKKRARDELADDGPRKINPEQSFTQQLDGTMTQFLDKTNIFEDVNLDEDATCQIL